MVNIFSSFSRFARVNGLRGLLLACFFLPAARAQFTLPGTVLVPPNLISGALYGYSVASSEDGSTVIVGAPGDGGSGAGAAYVWVLSDGAWSLEDQLYATDAIPSGGLGASQGHAVAISSDGNTALVGGPADNDNKGAVWVWVRDDIGLWSKQQKLVGDPTLSGPLHAAFQGAAVALSGDGNTAFVGGYADNEETGAVWVFTRDEDTWTQQARLVAPNSQPGYQGGFSLATSEDGTTLLAGSPGYGNVNGSISQGAAWIWTADDDGVWTTSKILIAPDVSSTAQQGQSVALSKDGTIAAVGAIGDSPNGSVVVWQLSGDKWVEQPKFQTINANRTELGYSTAMTDNGLVGMAGSPADQQAHGSAFLFSVLNGAAGAYQNVASFAAPYRAQGFSVALAGYGNEALVGAPTSGTGGVTAYSTTVQPITIETNPPGPYYSVDGGPWQYAPTVVNLPLGTHTISVPATEISPLSAGIQYVSIGWSDGGANSHSITVTNGPATYQAIFTSRYQLTLVASPGAGGSVTPSSGAYYDSGASVTITATPKAGYQFTGWSDGGAASHSVTVNAPATYTATFAQQFQLTTSVNPSGAGTVTPGSGSYTAGTVVPVTATPNTGYSFVNWTGNVASTTSASTSVTMNSNQSVTANFQQASPSTLITFQTSPAGLQFTVDGGAAQPAPQTLSLAQGSHTIAVVSTQAGAVGTQYVYASWSDGHAASHQISVGATATTYLATFNTQYQLTMAASPPAGGTVTPASGTFYNAGTAVPIVAAANVGYAFSGWSGAVASAGSASTTATMNAPLTATANFASLSGITMQTSPPGLQFTLDGGSAQTAPQTLNLSQGAHTIAVAATQAGGAGTQYVFSSWSDGGAASHSITVGSAAATYTATFTVQYLLTLSVSPAGAGAVTSNPSSAGYYNSGASVQLSAAANPGFQFSNWTGDLSGGASPQAIAMNAPHSVTANFTAAGATCTFSFSPPSLSLPATGTSTPITCPNNSGQPSCGTGPEVPAAFTVTPSVSCGPWTATSSNPEFLQITGGASGNGVGTAGFTLLNNTHNAAQSYTVTVASGAASATYSVTQAGSGNSQVYREVYALYEQLLGRDPDAAGFGFWTGSGGAGLGQMADSFLTSPESFNSNFAVMAAHQAATGTPPTFAQFTAAVASIRAGTQTVTGLFNFLTGPGYSATALYQNLMNRTPSAGEISSANQAGLASWFQTLIGAPASVTPVASPNNEFQNTGTYSDAPDHSNALYLQMLYYTILSRDPDPAGFGFWLGVANGGGPGILFQGAAGFSARIQILGPGTPNQGYIGSPEFQGLFVN